MMTKMSGRYKSWAWRHKTFCYEVKNISWCKWHQKYVFKIFCSRNDEKNVRTLKAGHEIRHDNNKFALKQRTHHDVKKFAMTSKSASWRPKVRHVINNLYNVKTFVMTSKALHTLWRLKNCYDVINTSWF